jgi:hypothetical protein
MNCILRYYYNIVNIESFLIILYRLVNDYMNTLELNNTCRMKVSISEPCNGMCKSVRFKSKGSLDFGCIGVEKLSLFLSTTDSDFSISLSAFYSAPKEVLDEFCSSSFQSYDILKFFFMVGDPTLASLRMTHLTNEVLLRLLKDHYFIYLDQNSNIEEEFLLDKFLSNPVNQIWNLLPESKLKEMILLCHSVDDQTILNLLIQLTYNKKLANNLKEKINYFKVIQHYVSQLEELIDYISKANSIKVHLLIEYFNNSIYKILLEDTENLKNQKIFKMNRILEKLQSSNSEEYLRFQIHILNNFKNDFYFTKKIKLNQFEFVNYVKNGDYNFTNKILFYFNTTDPKVIINIYNDNKNDIEFFDNFTYFCWLNRHEEKIYELINREDFPNDLLIQITYFNYGRWIMDGKDPDDYFQLFTTSISSKKSMQLLTETDLLRMDLHFALSLLANLDNDNMKIFFKDNSRLEKAVEKICSIFLTFGVEKMEKFFVRNSLFFHYLLTFIINFLDKPIVNKFIKTYQNSFLYLDRLIVLTQEIKKIFLYDNPEQLVENDSERIWFIINNINGLDNLNLVLRVFEKQGLFLNHREMDYVFNLTKDQFLKKTITRNSSISDELSRIKLSNSNFFMNEFLGRLN